MIAQPLIFWQPSTTSLIFSTTGGTELGAHNYTVFANVMAGALRLLGIPADNIDNIPLERRDKIGFATADAAKAKYERQLGAKITVATRNSAPFYNAEGYHQDYYKKNPVAYERYRIGCGRPQALRVVWGGLEAH